uniref:Uncharacterized protein n=1 Tax=Cyclopterus lumpus TaxID=8103 RepID=A0A8C2X0G3_CYCLU
MYVIIHNIIHTNRVHTCVTQTSDHTDYTSDEEQEDLPFDCDLGSPYFNQTATSEGDTSSDGRETIHANDIIQRLLSAEQDANTKRDNLFDASKPRKVAPSCPCPFDLNQLLLRHFSQEELLRPCRLIEAETLPEVSLLESGDDTVFSCAPTHNSSTINSNHSDSPACNSEINQSFCSDRTDEKSASGKPSSLEDEAEREIATVTSATSDSITSSSASKHSDQGSGDTSALDVEKREQAEEDEQVQRVPLVRTRSFSEMKYGQGQVHYPLPDFSKVAPKVKIPKTPNGPARPVPQSPGTMHRAQSSPEMLEVVSRVLEDSVQPSVKPYVFKDEDKHLPLFLEKPRSNNQVMNTTSSSQPEEGPSDGERMTAQLIDIISQFMQKVRLKMGRDITRHKNIYEPSFFSGGRI